MKQNERIEYSSELISIVSDNCNDLNDSIDWIKLNNWEIDERETDCFNWVFFYIPFNNCFIIVFDWMKLSVWNNNWRNGKSNWNEERNGRYKRKSNGFLSDENYNTFLKASLTKPNNKLDISEQKIS